MDETITLNELVFEVVRSPRRKTVGILVDRDGQLKVKAPDYVTIEQIQRFVQSRSEWIYIKLQTKQSTYHRSKPRQYVNGEGFHYLGKSYRLRIVHVEKGDDYPALRLQAGWFQLREDEILEADKHFAEWYASHGLSWIRSRVILFSRLLGAHPSDIKIRDLGYRWASCGKKDVINFHWRLVTLPPSIIEYVVAHELAHLISGRHSQEFWGHLLRVMPDFQSRKKQLDQIGGWYL